MRPLDDSITLSFLPPGFSVESGKSGGFDARDFFREASTQIVQSDEARKEFANHRQFMKTQEYITHEGGSERSLSRGGVGYGVFYNNSFQNRWTTGTGIYWHVVCPNTAGGNLKDYLYLTEMNRATRGVEALIWYYGSGLANFQIYDWARPEKERWQGLLPFSSLTNYLRVESAHGANYQVLPLLNLTFEISTGEWRNQVWLQDNATQAWNLIYQFDYRANLQDQQKKDGDLWGPIVETFQGSHSGTSPVGALNIQIISRDSNSQWGRWKLLESNESYIRDDQSGFVKIFLEENYSWVVNS